MQVRRRFAIPGRWHTTVSQLRRFGYAGVFTVYCATGCGSMESSRDGRLARIDAFHERGDCLAVDAHVNTRRDTLFLRSMKVVRLTRTPVSPAQSALFVMDVIGPADSVAALRVWSTDSATGSLRLMVGDGFGGVEVMLTPQDSAFVGSAFVFGDAPRTLRKQGDARGTPVKCSSS